MDGPMDYATDLACDAATLDLPRVLRALESCGCFVLRGALPRAPLAVIHDAAVAAYEDMEQRHRAGELSEIQVRRNHGYGVLRPFEDDLRAPDGAALRQMMLGFVDDSALGDIVAGYLGPDVSMLLEACHIRRQAPGQPGRPVPLHQDGKVMRMARGRLLNFWVPLVDGAGLSAPGLEFYPKSLDRILHCAQRPKTGQARDRMYSNFEIAEADVRAAIGDLAPWRPVLDSGDVLCLDGWSVHRTHFDPGMTRARIGFELRFCRTADVQPEMPGRIAAFSPERQVA